MRLGEIKLISYYPGINGTIDPKLTIKVLVFIIGQEDILKGIKSQHICKGDHLFIHFTIPLILTLANQVYHLFGLGYNHLVFFFFFLRQ